MPPEIDPFKTGRVDDLIGVGGLREWRFVPPNWVDPLPHHAWVVVTDPVVVAKWKERLELLPPQTWYVDGKVAYTAEVSYDERVRPVLVLVGGIV